MKKYLVSVILLAAFFAANLHAADKPLRIIAFGAHPDDAEFQMGGTAIKLAKAGHKVKFVSVTNGDIGHWKVAGGQLAIRRTKEVQEAARRAGIEVEVLDIHDGELEPTLENRKKITRLIRNWQADMVFAHRPWDYHPDHRYTGVLVQDAAFMVSVPFICPDTPPLKKHPVFFYFQDRFTKPYPFKPDVAVSIDDVFEEKLHVIDALESQVYEGGALASPSVLIKRKADNPEARKKILRASWSNRQGRIANQYRDELIKWYGEKDGKAVKHAEAFEICEYGHQPSKAELKILFPFLDK
ncbi:MAG: GlcNAc-PI de-N-acetylase [Opitutae bacterium]|nr:GlcNAc-PI de-N-acetylase [Opitutae bacterium]